MIAFTLIRGPVEHLWIPTNEVFMLCYETEVEETGETAMMKRDTARPIR